MTAAELIRDIAKRKEAMKITNQMLADASGVPKATVDRILRGDTPNPSMQSVLDMAYAVGFRIVNDNDQHEGTVDSHLVEMLLRESRLKTIQCNSLLAEKDRAIAEKHNWLKFLAIALIAAAVLLVVTWAGFALLMHYDLTHLDVGWFQG